MFCHTVRAASPYICDAEFAEELSQPRYPLFARSVPFETLGFHLRGPSGEVATRLSAHLPTLHSKIVGQR